MPWRIPVKAAAEESVRPILEAKRRPDVQQLAERPRMEGQGDLDRHRFDAIGGRATRPGDGHRRFRSAMGRDHAFAEGEPAGRFGVPAQPQRGKPGHRLGAGRRLDLGRGQQVGERVEVVADPDPTFAHAWSGVVPRPEKGSRTTSPGRE